MTSRRLTLKGSGFAVFDEFLVPGEFAFVRRALSSLEFRRVGADYLSPSAGWSPEDVAPYESRPYSLPSPDATRDPVTVALSLVVKALRDVAPSLDDLIDPSHERVVFRSFLYQQSSGLTWHSDSRKSGGIVLYYHDKWHRRWGGELLVADPSLRLERRHGTASHETEASVAESEDDDGYCIRALSNRLVVLRQGTAHKIAVVSPAAGAHVRRSLTGFFVDDADPGVVAHAR